MPTISQHPDYSEIPEEMLGERPPIFHAIPTPWGDPFHDDTELACGVENPEPCESCQ